jgi:hypothetical protein
MCGHLEGTTRRLRKQNACSTVFPCFVIRARDRREGKHLGSLRHHICFTQWRHKLRGLEAALVRCHEESCHALGQTTGVAPRNDGRFCVMIHHILNVSRIHLHRTPPRRHAELYSTGISQGLGGAILPLGHLGFRDNAVRDRAHSAALRKLVHYRYYEEDRGETALYVMARFTADSNQEDFREVTANEGHA